MGGGPLYGAPLPLFAPQWLDAAYLSYWTHAAPLHCKLPPPPHTIPTTKEREDVGVGVSRNVVVGTGSAFKPPTTPPRSSISPEVRSEAPPVKAPPPEEPPDDKQQKSKSPVLTTNSQPKTQFWRPY